MAKPSLPQGTRDFGPDVVRKRTYILDTLRYYFELYGFQPLETPAMENLETLMGKYGDEGDKLIFKILNNGLDNPDKEKTVRADFEKILSGKNAAGISERALKYDLTIPFARYVAMNHTKLVFPFKRYQVQPVWRADRPQRGRYREFYQCDADIVGSTSLLNEVELLSLYTAAFTKLGIGVQIHVNHRKILQGLSEVAGAPELMQEITTTIDKLDKIGSGKVKEELLTKGLSSQQVEIIDEYLLTFAGANNDTVLNSLRKLLNNSPEGQKGIAELDFILKTFAETNAHSIVVDPTLARGLNYYTGAIIEVKALDVSIGSIAGGGRYDDLTGLFGVPDIPGVGISFGVDRIYDVMEELSLFPTEVHTGTQALFFNLGESESKVAFQLLQRCREHGIRSELYHESAKFDKQFKYAEKKNIPYIIIIGEKEIASQECMIKDLRTSVQESVAFDEISSYLSNK